MVMYRVLCLATIHGVLIRAWSVMINMRCNWMRGVIEGRGHLRGCGGNWGKGTPQGMRG